MKERKMIFADHAATTKLDPEAFEAMKPYLLDEYSNASQLYAFARKPKAALKEARACIASCIGALPEEIYFTSGGTESDNWAIKGSAFADAEKRATITSDFEHHAVLHSCAAIERLGYPVAYMRPTEDGCITPEILDSYITANSRLVSVMMVNNEIGSIQPIRELARVAHAHGTLFHTDAVQALGHIDVDVDVLGVDMLSASAHKFNGPKGVGFLYIRKGTPIVPLLDGGAQEQALRAGTENAAGAVGMAEALRLNCEKVTINSLRLARLGQMLVEQLRAAGLDFTQNGGDHTLPGLLSLSFPGADGEAILHRMDLMGISISTGSACNSKSTEVSHVLRAIRLEESLAKGTIRISFGKDNTEEDVVKIAAALVRIRTNLS